MIHINQQKQIKQSETKENLRSFNDLLPDTVN